VPVPEIELEQERKAFLLQLYEMGLVTPNTVLREFGFDPNQEIQSPQETQEVMKNADENVKAIQKLVSETDAGIISEIKAKRKTIADPISELELGD